MDIVNQAMEELIKMATVGEPLWLRSFETGREILNYDEYMKEFAVENSDNGRPKRSIEASRETGVIFVDLPRLVQCFLDAVRHLAISIILNHMNMICLYYFLNSLLISYNKVCLLKFKNNS